MEIVQRIAQGDKTVIEEYVDNLFNTGHNEALQSIKQLFSQFERQDLSELENRFKLILESFWYYFQSQKAVVEIGDYKTGYQQLQVAIQGFERLEAPSYINLSKGMLLYYAAVLDVQAVNISSGLEKLEEAKKHFNAVDKYGQLYEQLLESFEAEGYYIQSVKLLTEWDFDNAKICAEKGYSAAKKIAEKYRHSNALEFNTAMGMAHFYLCNYHFTFQFQGVYNHFNFDYFLFQENEVEQEANKAIEYLSAGDFMNKSCENTLYLAKINNILSKVIFELGKNMYYLLNDQTTKLNIDFKYNKTVISSASKMASKLGDAGIVYIRFCKLIGNQLNYLQKIFTLRDLENQHVHSSIVQLNKVTTKQVTDFLKKDKLEKALNLLSLEMEDSEGFDQVLLFTRRLSACKKDFNTQSITKEKLEVEKSNIAKAILDFI